MSRAPAAAAAAAATAVADRCLLRELAEWAVCVQGRAEKNAPSTTSDRTCVDVACPANAAVPKGATVRTCQCNKYWQYADLKAGITWNTKAEIWKGSCVDVDECATKPCSGTDKFGGYRGACREDGAGSGKFRCSCSSGRAGCAKAGCFAGTKGCQTNVDDCLAKPCKNGAKCTDAGINKFTCGCTAGWSGSTCAGDFPDCVTKKPCKNGASCTEGAAGTGKFACNCASGWAGVICDNDEDDCAKTPCTNGATCTEGAAGSSAYKCSCAAGWTGKTCATDIDGCASNPCSNKDKVSKVSKSCRIPTPARASRAASSYFFSPHSIFLSPSPRLLSCSPLTIFMSTSSRAVQERDWDRERREGRRLYVHLWYVPLPLLLLPMPCAAAADRLLLRRPEVVRHNLRARL